jgi:uncharacterized membrane protein YciS (DUF1049 family)
MDCENDPVVVTAMRQACHYNLYALANSAAMNGVGENTTVTLLTLPLVTLLRVLMGLCAAAALVCGLLWRRGKIRWMRSKAYLNYQTLRITLREEKVEQKTDLPPVEQPEEILIKPAEEIFAQLEEDAAAAQTEKPAQQPEETPAEETPAEEASVVAEETPAEPEEEKPTET